MRRRPSRIAIANRKVSFDKAAGWAGLFHGGARDRGNKVSCPFCFDGGSRDPAFRVYPDHGYCYAGCGYFTPVRLLAESWGLSREDAAHEALSRIGWRPPTVENLWEEATQEPEPDRESLATALVVFCDGLVPDWKTRQYDPQVASILSQCLGLLPLVHTSEECRQFLARCKVIMQRCLLGRDVGQDQAQGST